MKLFRLLLAGAALAGVAGLALVGKSAEAPANKMADAAEKFLTSLRPEQKAKTTFDFDADERTNWYFVPLQNRDRKPTRKGLGLYEMTDEQRDAALGLLRAGTSGEGYTRATTVMSLEAILAELEKGRATVRDPGWYFFSIFGTPSKTGRWGWRVEGHHLSLNFTLDKGKVVSATPAFFGANPATFMSGANAGQRTLSPAENLARALINLLDDGQKKAALQDKQFSEIEQGKAVAAVGEPKGLPASKMNKKQRALLVELIEGYARRMPKDVAEAQIAEVRAAGIDKVHFAYFQAPDRPGNPYTYRVRGPTFVIEFLNVQADAAGYPANHVHSAWRNIQGDFGIERK